MEEGLTVGKEGRRTKPFRDISLKRILSVELGGHVSNLQMRLSRFAVCPVNRFAGPWAATDGLGDTWLPIRLLRRSPRELNRFNSRLL